mgnify:FL=1
MKSNCDWCGKLFINVKPKYNGAWHYSEVIVEGFNICVDCLDKFNEAKAKFVQDYLDARSK